MTATSTSTLIEMGDPESVWIAGSGNVDLFAVPLKQTREEGSLHHLLRANSGGAIFGVARLSSSLKLRGRSSNGSELRCIPRNELLEDCQRREDSKRALLGWICQLGDSIVDRIPPREAKRLQSGKPMETSTTAAAIYTNETVAWVQLLAGSFSLHGEHPAELAPGQYFPVTRNAWIEIDPQTRVEVASFESLTKSEIEGAIDAFHRTMLAAIESSIQRSDDRFTERLKRRQEADADRYSNSLRRMGSALQSKADGVRAPSSRDRLFAAASEVASANGIKLTPPAARAGVQNGIEALARASGVRARKVILRDKWWKSDSGPLLAFRDKTNEPIGLLPNGRGGYNVYDPEANATEPLDSKASASFAPTAYSFCRPFPAKPITGVDLMILASQECRPELMMIAAVGLFTSLLSVLVPYATGVVYDSTIPGADRVELLRVALFLLGSTIGSMLFTLTRSFALMRLETKMEAFTQAAVWDRLLGLPVTFFKNYTAGDLAQRSMGISQIRQMLTSTVVSSILSGIFSISNFALLFFYSVPMALTAAGLIFAAVLLSVVLGYTRVRLERDLARERGKLSGLLLQFLTGIAKLRISGTEDRAFAQWADRFGLQRQLSLRIRRHTRVLNSVISIYPVLSLMFLFYYGSRTMDGSTATLTAGQFLAFMTAFNLFLSSTLQLSSAAISVLSILPAYERATPILRALPEVMPSQVHPGVLSGRIEVNQVTFGYDKEVQPIVNELSLTIEAGQFVALVGGSGCGKSTLLRLLLGFETADSGAIFFDGQNMAQLDIQAIRRQIGVVLQNGSVFRGDIFQNIVGSAPLAVEDAWEAARLAAFDKDIEAMPMGMHTVITEDGGLSGGQRQRLMIARAIVNRPRILLFDEATSALDNATQETVSRSLEQLQATRIVVAHRLSTIVKADCIYVLEKGRVAQQGTYQELLSVEGPFLELARRQLL